MTEVCKPFSGRREGCEPQRSAGSVQLHAGQGAIPCCALSCTLNANDCGNPFLNGKLSVTERLISLHSCQQCAMPKRESRASNGFCVSISIIDNNCLLVASLGSGHIQYLFYFCIHSVSLIIENRVVPTREPCRNV